jgi:hypothetical protein
MAFDPMFRTALRGMLALSLMLQMFAPLVATPTYAANGTVSPTASFGGAGTYKNPTTGAVFAKANQPVTLQVTTDASAECVVITGSFSGTQNNLAGTANWTFPFTTPSTGAVAVSATVGSKFNKNNQTCNTDQGTASASLTVDSAGPIVSGSLSAATPANGAGWFNNNVAITWSASDGASGVASGPTPATDSVTSDSSNANGTNKTASATDNVGNQGNGSVVVKLDKTPPTITGSAAPAANANGWNNTNVTVSFSCGDVLSGLKSGTCAPTTLSGEGANQSVTGTASDNADNAASATVGNINIDKTAPTLSGAPTTAANADGWYKGDVAIHWTASDALSGVDAATEPADSTISGEGKGLTATATVKDKAGNQASATSAGVNIDRTAPITTASAPAGWNNTNVSVSLAASDSLSGVKATYYTLDGGTQQSGTSVAISSEGDHTLQYWSADVAGNIESAQTVHVKIDKTAPSITHTDAPAPNTNGWNNADVTVTFTCADTLSGVASCGPNKTVTTEGANQQVDGTAVDNAGNTAADPALVSIDKTAPTISAAADRSANANGWYNADITVSFSCKDALSGVAACPAPQTLGEGANQSAQGTATDAAGNPASASLGGINVDKTAPTLSGAPITAANAAGWYRGDVTVAWSCNDPLSGIDGACPANTTITGEGDNLSTSASVSDKAGNAASATLSGIKIDRTAPSTSTTVPSPLASGWYTGPVQVTLAATDGLSGVATTYYSVDSGAPQTYAGPFSDGLKGSHAITYWSVDNAGNTEDNTAAGHTLTLKIDDIPPSTAASMSPTSPNGSSGWFTTSVDITLVAGDAESGVAATYYAIDGGAPQTYTTTFTFNQLGSHTVTYWSVDNAGNVEDVAAKNNSLSILFDNLPPTISGSRTPAANSFGWNNGDVTVSFTCADAQSGLASTDGCTAPVTLSNEGADQSFTGNAQDAAGNSASATVDNISIDKTAPVLTGLPTSTANAAGWYTGNVTVHWTAQDGLSGIDPGTVPADSVITGEAKGLSANVSVSDKAGNQGNGSVSVNIDHTAPVVKGAATTYPNAAGWYNKSVTVHFTCTDALSGVASCPSDKVLSTDGANQSVTSDPATDQAGNSSAGATVGGINIDGIAPQTTANNQCDGANGWCRGNTATVVLTATDQAGLSGVKEIHSSVDGKPEQVNAGTMSTVNVPLAAKSGMATVTYYAIDNAGNKELPNQVALKYDNIAPTVTHTLAPAANAAGWNNATTTVHFDAKDDDFGSGMDPATVTPDQVISAETSVAGTVVNGQAKDLAGNLGTDSVTVKLDKTAPTISGAPTTAANSNGWYNGPVTVHFTCADSLSGVATCPADQGVTTNGANQSVTAAAIDSAGNSTSTTVNGLNIDAEKPVITVSGVMPGSIYTLGAVPTVSCAATDGFSGINANGCTVSISGGSANGVGTFTYTATATDKAGNTSTVTNTYKVIYRWDGFLQPINDTAHQIGLTTSIFKGGSTVPAKFQLKKADGTIVQSGATPQWLTPTRGSTTSAPVDETVYSDTATSGTTFQWDATGQQYIYNWSTKSQTAGYYYRVGVKLDDGQTYTVDVGLR